MGRITTLEERILINELSAAGYTDPEIAEQLGWSRATVRKWRRRGVQGREHLESHLGRPVTGELSSYPAHVRQTLLAWRAAHPTWGAKTLHHELRASQAFAPEEVPSRAQIGRFLHAQGLTRRYEPHAPLPQSDKQTPRAPHEEWEMDAKGYQPVPEVGLIAFINLNDRYSHARLACYPCYVGARHAERRPVTEDYQTLLRRAFSEWGLPDRLAVDHDSVFVDNRSPSPFPTRFHLWLIALGVELVFGRKGRPTDQGLTERSHQLWEQQVVAGQSFATWQALYDALCARQPFLNEVLPCATLDDQPPLVAYPEARYPRRAYRPEWERELCEMAHVHRYLAQGRWFRTVTQNGRLSLGGRAYPLGQAYAGQQLEITFDPAEQDLLFHAADGSLAMRHPVQGISPSHLMGDLSSLLDLPAFQLALPFTWDEWRQARLSESLGVRHNES
jgi:transposase